MFKYFFCICIDFNFYIFEIKFKVFLYIVLNFIVYLRMSGIIYCRFEIIY